MICDYDYVASVCCRIYPAKTRSKSQHRRLLESITTACGNAGLPISYNLGEHFAHLAGTQRGIDMYLPIIMANICYVDVFKSTPSILQTESDHYWVVSHSRNGMLCFDTNLDTEIFDLDVEYHVLTNVGYIDVPVWNGNAKEAIQKQKQPTTSIYEHWCGCADLTRVREASWCSSGIVVQRLFDESVNLRLSRFGIVSRTGILYIVPRLITEWCVENQIRLLNKNPVSELESVWDDIASSSGSEFKRLCDSVFGTVKLKGKYRGDDFTAEIPYSEYLELAKQKPGNKSRFVVDSIGASPGPLDFISIGSKFADGGDDDRVDELRTSKQPPVPVTSRTRPKSVPGQNSEKPWLSRGRKRF